MHEHILSSFNHSLDKLRGDALCGGGRMPLGGDALDGEALAGVVRWICRGALED